MFGEQVPDFLYSLFKMFVCVGWDPGAEEIVYEQYCGAETDDGDGEANDIAYVAEGHDEG